MENKFLKYIEILENVARELQAENQDLKGLIRYYKAQIVELKKKIKSQKETLRYYRKKPTVFKNWV